jgi:hypothetical protein
MFLDILSIIKDPFSSETKVADLLRSSLWDIDKISILKLLKKLSSINYIKKDKIKIFEFLTTPEYLDSLFPKIEEELQ